VLDLMRSRELAARQTRAAGEIWLFDPARTEDWLGRLRDVAG